MRSNDGRRPRVLRLARPPRRRRRAGRVERDGAYADRALAAEATRARLDPRERAFATQLAYGAVQRRRTLDHVIAACSGRPVERLDPPVRDALRLGVLQLLFLDGVAPHAAVDQSVELAKAAGGPGFKLVNAVLRRAGREGPALLAALDDATPGGAALRHSVPDWIAQLWWEALGAETARALLAHVNEPAESALRVNALAAEPAAVAAELAERGVATRPAPAALDGVPLAEGLLVDGPFDPANDPLWEHGRARRAVARGDERRARCSAARGGRGPGSRVLDLCAAPGGKATHLAALVGQAGRSSRSSATPDAPTRCAPPASACAPTRSSASRRPTPPSRATTAPSTPCSSTRRAAASARSRDVPTCAGARAQRRSSRARGAAGEDPRRGCAGAKPGGALVYCTCTISPRENEQVVGAPPRRPRRASSWSASTSCCRTATERTDSSMPACGARSDITLRMQRAAGA